MKGGKKKKCNDVVCVLQQCVCCALHPNMRGFKGFKGKMKEVMYARHH